MRPTGDEVADLLVAGTGVDVVALPMSGRSTLLDVAADRVRERGRGVVRAAGAAPWRERPLAALSVLDLGAAGPPASAADLVRTLTAAMGSRPGALVVDDVDDLDLASTGVLLAVHRATGAPLLTSRRPGSDHADHAPGVRDLLGGTRPGVAVELAPLPFADMHRVVHDLLGGPVDPALVASVAVLAGGMPGVAAALITAGRAEGVLVEADGIWVDAGRISPAGLARALAPLLRDLTTEDQDGLTLLALVGRAPVPTARRLAPGPVLPRLERSGLVTVTADTGVPTTTVTPPALAEALIATCGYARRDELDLLVADQLTPRTAARGPDRAAPGRAVGRTKRVADHWEAERRLLLRAWQDAPGPAAAAALLTATLVCGPVTPSPQEIRDRTDLTSDDPAAVEAAVRFELAFAWYLAVHHRSVPEARAHLDACAHRHPAHAATVAAARSHIDTVFDHVPDDDELDALDRRAATAARTARDAAAAVRVEAALFAGRPATARRLLGTVPPGGTLLRSVLEAAPGLALLLEGDVAGGTHEALEGVRSALQRLEPGPMQAHAYVATLGLTLAGRFAEVDALVGESLTLTTRTSQEEHFRAGVVALAAIAAGWQGRWDYSRRLTLQTRALDPRIGPLPGLVSGPLFAFANRRGLSQAAEELWEAAEERLTHGFLVNGVLTAVSSIERAPVPERAARLLRALDGSESPLLVTLGQYADATARRDGDGLDAVQPLLSGLGVHTYAVRSVVTAALVRREQGDARGGLDRIAHAWELTDRIDGTQVAFFHPYVRAMDLSARELEVVDLISTGLTAGEVATGLGISQRTVESHLLSVYRKTGLASRDDLGIAAATWLAPSSR
jgi:DNA-binding CsgD family transcriptional regulator